MKKRNYLIILLVLLLTLSGCQAALQNTTPLPEIQPRKVIIDTDTAGDDAAAIIMAALSPEIDILGVTVVSGNVSLEQGAKNALMSLEVAERTDVPVYLGAQESMAGIEYELFSVYGKDGMGDADLIHPTSTPESMAAVDFILQSVAEAPGEIDLITLGPMTNIARAIQQDPNTMSQVKNIWVMGASGFGPGNASPVAEFNVFKDPDAFKVLVDSGLSVTLVGLDVITETAHISRSEQEAMMKGNELEQFIGAAINKLMEFERDKRGEDTVVLPDALAMACMLWDGYIQKTVSCHASVIVEPGETYGQVILYQEGFTYESPVTFDNYNISVVTETNDNMFKPWFFDTLKNQGQ
ncbi:MAG: nucleoside hydrolase [Clostridia bacterium]|nr:nucleoside hydrolase [Clostridia bacterium]